MAFIINDPVNLDPDGGALQLGTSRPLLDIFNDLNALSGAQKTAIWTAFTAGNPQFWTKDGVILPGTPGATWGTYAPAVSAHSFAAINMPLVGTFDATKQTIERLKMVAIYLYDNPNWLKNPAFDPTINVLPYTP